MKNKPEPEVKGRLLSCCCDAQPWGENGPHWTGTEWMGVCRECKEHFDFYDDEAEEEREFTPVQKQLIAELSKKDSDEA